MAFLNKKNNQWRVQILHTYFQGTPHSYFSNSLPFLYSAILFGHDCETTWQNMEMDTEKFRNAQESERYDIYVSGTKRLLLVCIAHAYVHMCMVSIYMVLVVRPGLLDAVYTVSQNTEKIPRCIFISLISKDKNEQGIYNFIWLDPFLSGSILSSRPGSV